MVAPPRRLQRVPRGFSLWTWLGYLDKYVLFIPSLALQSRWADVVHICDHSNGMYVRWVKRKPTMITCHDVIAMQAAKGLIAGWNVGWTGRLFQRLKASGMAKAPCEGRRPLLAVEQTFGAPNRKTEMARNCHRKADRQIPLCTAKQRFPGMARKSN
ncbi:hypothetical protein [Variovorax sp. J22R115]|uniref:hypothetical protein n=1 Tax=Variovorax sp. J22R115 TaxID=3053509 RepID=UPI002577F816|nr:hypothetical protein [Variovorax sp. J22R115]MDM0050009.1 hypothetical protein [Variovorax sp. J22R115]